jgi:hypothetical protein
VTWSPAAPLKRIAPGGFAFLRVRVLANTTEDGVVVELVDREGNQINNVRHYVPEPALISTAEAMQAVRERLR